MRAVNGRETPVLVVSLPFAYRDGRDKYDGIMRYVRETRLDCTLRIIRDTLNVEQFRQSLSSSVVGAICGTVGCFDGSRHDAALLTECLCLCQRRKIPLVGLDWPLEAFRERKLRRCSFFNIDPGRIGEVAAHTLLSAGNYVAYGFVGFEPLCAWSRNRGAFFARELRKSGHSAVQIFKGDPQTDASGLSAWLRALPKPVGVFAANDYTADLVLRACLRSGLRVPDDLAVLGVDDDPVFCVHTRPTLSSIHPDFEEMGYLAAEELLRLVAERSAGARRVVAGEPTVTGRMSTAPCSPAGRLVRRIDEIIAARACQEGLDSNVIADELRISRRLLDLRYRQYKGMSVKEAVVRTRVDCAKKLLAYSGHSIGTVSRMCGYRTESYLGQVFLRLEGVSMGDFRAKKTRHTCRLPK